MTESLEKLEKKIGYTFKTRSILERALTHRSASKKNDHLDDYERLEFLGDRVLSLVIAEMLLGEFGQEAVGAIAKRHSALVRGETLVKIANEIGLPHYIKMGKSDMLHASAIEDVCEALIAALYRDGGIEVAQPFIEKFWYPYLHKASEPPQDDKSRLQEWAQGKRLPLPDYDVVDQIGPDHNPEFKIRVTLKGYDSVYAQAKSKKEAEKMAAKKMYEMVTKS